jgi:hypothetical protein
MTEEGATRRAQEARRILEDSGAILHGGHFVYISGDHGDGWIDKDAIFPHTERVSCLAADCDLCRRGVPINTRFAHGADFLAAQRAG